MSYNLRKRTDSTEMTISAEIKDYLQCLISPLIKSVELKKILDEFKSEVLGKIEILENKLADRDKAIKEQYDKIERIDSELKVVIVEIENVVTWYRCEVKLKKKPDYI